VGGLAKLPELRTLASLEKLRQRAREYKERCTRDLYEDIEEMVVNIIKTLTNTKGNPTTETRTPRLTP
jgi:hypothetical protein